MRTRSNEYNISQHIDRPTNLAMASGIKSFRELDYLAEAFSSCEGHGKPGNFPQITFTWFDPNIIMFCSCRVHSDRITDLVLKRHESSLKGFPKQRNSIDKQKILNGLDSTIHYLQKIGLAHNDINLGNVILDKSSGEAILVDFESSHKIGDKMKASRGTNDWMEDGDDYAVSKESHDISA
jgi:serine/threonine protein kinase